MEMWGEIRRKVLAEGQAKRSICREYDISWKTLEKILSNVEPPGYRSTKPRPKPVIGPHIGFIQSILEADKDDSIPKKQRHTAKRIYERLIDERGYKGSYTPVRRTVAEMARHSGEVFFPLAHDPAWGQFDFGEAKAHIGGIETKIHYAVMSLTYSDALFVVAYPRETSEAFLDAHVRAFEFFGGVPRKISYDNSKIAVAQITGSNTRVTTREFNRLKSHFLFDDHFCRVRASNEKGHVETLVGYSRRNFMVPIPRASSFEELNAKLAEDCQKALRRVAWGDPRSVGERLEEERATLLEIRPDFTAARVTTAKANSLSLVRFDNNDYSVPVRCAHHDLAIEASVSHVSISMGPERVARHERLWGKGGVKYDYRHYLALLERKPGALDYSAPLREIDFTEPFIVLRARMEAELGDWGMHEYIKVLQLLGHATFAEVEKAITKALVIGVNGQVKVPIFGQIKVPTRSA